MGTDSEARLLVVEDEPNIRELLATSLRFAGFEVHTASNGTEAIRLAGSLEPDLVVLDVMLPDLDGFAVTRRIRESGKHIPIVFVTARDSLDDKIKGLTVGGDDYVTKPFSITELLARVRAVLRRTTTRPPTEDIVRIGDLEIDFKLHQARREKRRVEFTAREFELLRYFVQHRGKVVTREQILNEVWGYEEFPTTRTIDNFVAKLRQKIERAPHEPEHILTIHGSGYKFVG